MAITPAVMIEMMDSVMVKHAGILAEKIDLELQKRAYLESEKTLINYTMGFFEVEIEAEPCVEILNALEKIYKSEGGWIDVRFELLSTPINTAKRTNVKLIFRNEN